MGYTSLLFTYFTYLLTVWNRTRRKHADSFRPWCLRGELSSGWKPVSRTSSLTQVAVRHHGRNGSASLRRVLFQTVQSSSALLSDKVSNEVTNLYISAALWASARGGTFLPLPENMPIINFSLEMACFGTLRVVVFNVKTLPNMRTQ